MNELERARQLTIQSLDILKSNEELDPGTSFLDVGGQHLVFNIKRKNGKERGVVVKVDRKFLELALIKNLRAGKLEKYCDQTQERLQRLEKIFDQHILKEHIEIRKVPIASSVVNEIFASVDKKAVAVETVTLPTIVRVQERIPAEALENGKTFNTSYCEFRNDEEFCRNLNEMLIDETKPYDEELFFLTVSDSVRELVNQAKEDDALKAKIREFIEKAIQFTTEHNDQIDLVGSGNVLFFKKEGAWDFVIVDPFAGDDWNDGIIEIRNLINHQTDSIGAGTLNILAYVRFLNGISQSLSLGLKLDLNSKLSCDNLTDHYDKIYIALRKKFKHEVQQRPQRISGVDQTNGTSTINENNNKTLADSL